MAEESGMPPGAAGSPEGGHEPLQPQEEPVTTGTLFIMLVFLMALAAMWAIMYLTLLDR
ncbi:MAG: hypothetical protein JSV95_10695 [Gemmatimonadota bacterium]|jgi:hypothetical protein|nr:MAG: hypothetical protein JSV95_10695 [Gemmatimonadota bacterium]